RDQCRRDPRLGVFELVIDGAKRHAELRRLGLIRGMNRPANATDHLGHDIDDGREQQLPGVLLFCRIGEQLVNLRRRQSMLHDPSEHYRYGTAVHKALENPGEQHRLASWRFFGYAVMLPGYGAQLLPSKGWARDPVHFLGIIPDPVLLVAPFPIASAGPDVLQSRRNFSLLQP